MSLKKERSDSTRHRSLILQTAESLFAEHGVEAVTMHQIAKTVGIGQGTLYRKYANKNELMLDLLFDQSALFLDSLNDEVFKDEPTWTPHHRMECLIGSILRFWETHAAYITIMLTMPLQKRIPLKYKSHFYQGIRKIILRYLYEYRNNEQLGAPTRDLEFITDTIMASLAPDLYLHWRQVRGYTHQQVFERLTELYSNI